MLTAVILEGPLGKAFGRKWNLLVESPNDALRMIDANRPGVFAWIRKNLEKYSRYRVICKYEDGRSEMLNTDGYAMNRKCVEIRFLPTIEGAGGGVFQTVVGVALLVYGIVTANPAVILQGVVMTIGGVAQMLSPKPKVGGSESEKKDRTSYFFDGPVNTTMQGVPVQVIYGKCLVGSHAISAAVTVDQLM